MQMQPLRTGLMFALALCLPGFSSMSHAQTTFTNPILPRGADPSVIQVDHTYYSVNSGCPHAGAEPVICLRSAPSLSALHDARPKVIWAAPEAGPNAHDVWAPQIRFFDGRWYIYYAADPDNNKHHALFALVPRDASAPMGEWREANTGAPGGGFALDWKSNWAIDPDVFKASDQRYYLLFACRQYNSDTPQGNAQSICIAPMRDPLHVEADPRTGKIVAELSLPVRPWEIRRFPTQEGPFGFTHNGTDYILYSASYSGTPDDYAEGLLVNTHPPQPPGHDNPLLNPASWVKEGPVFDGHHASYGTASSVLVDSPDHTELWHVYHGTDCLVQCPLIHNMTWQDRSVRAQIAGWSPAGELVFGYPVDIRNMDGTGQEVPLPNPSVDGSGSLLLQMWGAAFGDAAEGSSMDGAPQGASTPTRTGALLQTGTSPEQMSRTFYLSNPNLQSYVLFTRLQLKQTASPHAAWGVYAAYVDHRNFYTATIGIGCGGASACVTTQGVVAGQPLKAQTCALPQDFDPRANNTLAVEADQGTYTLLVNDTYPEGACQGRHVFLNEGQVTANGSNGQPGILARGATVEFSDFTVSPGVPADSQASGTMFAFRNVATQMELTAHCSTCKQQASVGVMQYPPAAPYPLTASSAQLWTLRKHADGSYAVANSDTNLCLEEAGQQGTVSANRCNGGDAQKWWLLPVPHRSSFLLQSGRSRSVLEAAEGSSGAAIRLSSRRVNPLQQWQLIVP